MHFCGPDQLHGFEERLTTDIYPADFGWTPDWDRPHERPSWYHNMSSVAEAGLCVRTNQLDFDDEVVFAAEREIYDMARGNRPAAVPAGRLADPSARPLRDHASATGISIATTRSTCPVPRSRPSALDPHSRRLRHVCAIDAEPVTEAQVRAARRAYLRRDLLRRRQSRPADARASRRAVSPTTRSSSCSAITARCSASAGSGTR